MSSRYSACCCSGNWVSRLMQARRVIPQAHASVTHGVGSSVVTAPFLASQITRGQMRSICQQPSSPVCFETSICITAKFHNPGVFPSFNLVPLNLSGS